MVRVCCVPHCQSEQKSVGVSFHKFTSDKKLMKVWIHNIKRDTHFSKRNPHPFKVYKNTRICSLHFERKFRIINSQHSYLKKGAIPTIFEWNITKDRPSTDKIAKYFQSNRESLGTRNHITPNTQASTDQGTLEYKNGKARDDPQTTTEQENTLTNERCQNKIQQEKSAVPHIDYEILYNDLAKMFSAINLKYTALSKLHSKCMKTTAEQATQTDCQKYLQTDVINEVVTPLYTNVSLVGNRIFSWNFFESNENLLFFYTGFVDLESLQCSFDMLFDFKHVTDNSLKMHNTCGEKTFDNFKLSRQDQYVLFLMKLRQGFVYEHLKTLFQVSLGTVATVFLTWINFVYIRLASIDYWAHRDILLQNAVPNVQTTYKNVMGNLDCTEIFIQTPSSLIRQSQSFSNYKSHNTLKALIVTDMNGGILFASSLFTGSISDNKILVDSGFVDLVKNKVAGGFLQTGDVFLADKGFTAHSLKWCHY